MDTPLATIIEGYGSVMRGLAGGPGVTLKLNTTVTAINRIFGTGTARLSYEDTRTGEQGAQMCDIVILSGNMVGYTTTNPVSGKPAVLQPPTSEEVALFSGKESMQFMLSLVEFEDTPAAFEAIEYWPDNYNLPGGVILRRDVGYAETNGTRHPIGVIQTMSTRPDTHRSVCVLPFDCTALWLHCPLIALPYG